MGALLGARGDTGKPGLAQNYSGDRPSFRLAWGSCQLGAVSRERRTMATMLVLLQVIGGPSADSGQLPPGVSSGRRQKRALQRSRCHRFSKSQESGRMMSPSGGEAAPCIQQDWGARGRVNFRGDPVEVIV